MDEAKKMKIGEETQEEQKTLIQWIREHKKEIAIAGISITALVGLGLGIKNKEANNLFGHGLLSPFEWWCRNFILPDICKPCLFVFLRNLFYLTKKSETCVSFRSSIRSPAVAVPSESGVATDTHISSVAESI